MLKMFSGVKLSTSNYDALLLAWSKLDLQSHMRFNGGDSKYSEKAEDARQHIIDEFDWRITDGGKAKE
jgi:hypothetical protein